MTFIVHEPTTVTEAVTLLAAEGDAGAALAGGTDLLLRMRRGLRRYRSVVNLKKIPGFDAMTWDAGDLRLGPLVTFRTLETSPLVRARYAALAEAAHAVAGVQLRNLATIGGNIGNASPSADGVPPLVALGAEVGIASASAARQIPIEDCFIGPGRTVLTPGEVFASIRVPTPAAGSGNAFARFSPRSAMDIGIASVAASVTLGSDGRCTACRIAPGAVSPVPYRAEAAEAALLGERPTPALASRAGELAAAAARPITDIRGTADYRRAMVRVLTARVILAAASRAAATEARFQ